MQLDAKMKAHRGNKESREGLTLNLERNGKIVRWFGILSFFFFFFARKA